MIQRETSTTQPDERSLNDALVGDKKAALAEAEHHSHGEDAGRTIHEPVPERGQDARGEPDRDHAQDEQPGPDVLRLEDRLLPPLIG